MENPCFDGGHGQTETLSGLLVRESLKFAGFSGQRFMRVLDVYGSV